MAVGWYVAAIQRGKESALQDGLAQHGVEVYNPEIIAVKRGKKLREPLFPSYIFCLLDPQAEVWPQIRWAQGLRYFLGPDKQPTSVANSLIEEIRARVERWNHDGWESAFAPGQQVHIGAGALSGVDAVFSRYLPGRQRCEVLVALVGRTHALQITTVSLEARRPAGFLT